MKNIKKIISGALLSATLLGSGLMTPSMACPDFIVSGQPTNQENMGQEYWNQVLEYEKLAKQLLISFKQTNKQEYHIKSIESSAYSMVQEGYYYEVYNKFPLSKCLFETAKARFTDAMILAKKNNLKNEFELCKEEIKKLERLSNNKDISPEDINQLLASGVSVSSVGSISSVSSPFIRPAKDVQELNYPNINDSYLNFDTGRQKKKACCNCKGM